VLECQKTKKGALDQYGAERFGRLNFCDNQKSAVLKGLIAYVFMALLLSVIDVLKYRTA